MKTTDSPKAAKEIAAWFKNLRKHTLNLTQREVAQRAGIPLGTFRHFEQTGQVSLTNLLRIAGQLHVLHIFESLARGEEPDTLEKIQREKMIARLRDERSMEMSESTPMELREKNNRTARTAPKRWKLHGRDKWMTAPTCEMDA